MNEKTITRLYIIASSGFAVAGIIFLCLSIFTEPKNTTYLTIALCCTLISNLMNLLRAQSNKKRK